VRPHAVLKGAIKGDAALELGEGAAVVDGLVIIPCDSRVLLDLRTRIRIRR